MNVTHIVGGSFLGNLLSALCFGVLTVQTSTYYRAFPNDRRPLKLVVAFLWTLEAFQLVCGTQYLYWYLVTNYHDPLALREVKWEYTIFQISAVCASVTVQTFFAYRVYSLSANLYLGVLVQVLVLIQFGFGAANGIMLNAIDIEVVYKEYGWVPMSWMTSQAIADIVIATSMCLALRHQRTGFQKTDSVINRMVLYTISTGLITCVLACVLLGMFAKYGINRTIVTNSLPLGAFYSVTMLANLHTRKILRTKLDTPSLFEMISSSMKQRIWWKAGDPGNEESLHATRINIAREVVLDDDVTIKPMRYNIVQ